MTHGSCKSVPSRLGTRRQGGAGKGFEEDPVTYDVLKGCQDPTEGTMRQYPNGNAGSWRAVQVRDRVRPPQRAWRLLKFHHRRARPPSPQPVPNFAGNLPLATRAWKPMSCFTSSTTLRTSDRGPVCAKGFISPCLRTSLSSFGSSSGRATFCIAP